MEALRPEGVERLGAGLAAFGGAGTIDIVQLKSCLAAAGCAGLTDQVSVPTIPILDAPCLSIGHLG